MVTGMSTRPESLEQLDGRTLALVVLSAAIAMGREPLVEERCRSCLEAAVPPLWVDENMRIVRPPPGGDLTQRATLPPRYQLAANEICQQVAKAWKRDTERGNRKAQAALSRLAEGRWKRNPLERAMMLVTRLVSPFWWRRLFLAPPAFAPPEDDDEFAVTAASALAMTLGPWFTGKRELDYESFVGVLEWASAGFGKNPSSGGT